MRVAGPAVDSPDPRLPLTVGIDFGRTPAAAIAQKQDDGRWYVLHELVTENMSTMTEDVVENLRAVGYRWGEIYGPTCRL